MHPSLMQEAGVNLVSLGIFAWAQLEPGPGVHECGWLNEVMDLLHTHGITMDLATENGKAKMLQVLARVRLAKARAPPRPS